jgi:predicted ATP-grasp superfamily ATP-dependent carboligase
MNILLLDGNENQTVASVRSLAAGGHFVRVGSSSSWSKAGMSRYCRGTFTYPDPQADAEAFIRSVLIETSKFPGTFLLPMTERTTLPLSARRDDVFAMGGRMVLPPHDVVVRAFDKSETTMLARSLGISVPETALVHAEDSAQEVSAKLRFPVVLKPRTSFETTAHGSVRATGRPLYARDAQEFRVAFESLRHRSSAVVVQEFIEGVGAGYFALLQHGTVRAEFAHRRIRDVHPTGSGSSLRVSVRPDPVIREAGITILRALQWEGVAMVEFRVRPDGTPVFMEVNGRFWNSLALAIYAGVDFPSLLARMAEKGDVPSVAGYREGVRCRWLVGDFRHLLEVWRGAPRGFPGRYPDRLGTLLKFLVPVPGTFHDNFVLADPLPELGDWLDFFFRRLPEAWKKSGAVRENENAARGYSRT